MMTDNWDARVIYRPDMLANVVYLMRSVEGGREYLMKDQVIVSVKSGEVPKDDPYFALLDDGMIRALVVAFDSHGVKRPEESYVQGKLEATESHLADMRKLVLKEKA